MKSHLCYIYVLNIYPDLYRELDVDNIRVGYKPEKDGLLLWKGAYLSRTEESFFSWNIVSEIIEQLIDSGEYVTEEKAEPLPNSQDHHSDNSISARTSKTEYPENSEPIQFSIFDFSDSLPQQQITEVKSDEKTPLEIRSDLYREYLKKKAEYPDEILLYQHGDFYNIYGHDATSTHDIVTFIMTDVTMDNGETIPIYSIPKTQSKVYIDRLVENGFSVAISDEDNGQRQDTVLSPENVEKPSTSPMPVGVIDYLANDGTVGYSQEFYDEKEFVDEINDNSYAGVPTSVKVYNNPDTNEHISTSFQKPFHIF